MFTNDVNLGRLYYWNPWLGCEKVSEACDNCFIRHLNEFVYKGQLDNDYIDSIPTGSMVVVSLQTDFFLDQADPYRKQAWEMIKNHPDVIFVLITKRIERVEQCLPEDWGCGYNNVVITVTIENQKRADERLPYLRQLPTKHKWITCSPLLEEINIKSYLQEGFITHVECCGEIGDFKVIRETKYEWVKSLSNQCKESNVRFSLMKIGHKFNIDGKIYTEDCICYRSQIANLLKLDNNIPLTFKLKSIEKIF